MIDVQVSSPNGNENGNVTSSEVVPLSVVNSVPVMAIDENVVVYEPKA